MNDPKRMSPKEVYKFCKKTISKQLQNKNITRLGLITEDIVEKSFIEE